MMATAWELAQRRSESVNGYKTTDGQVFTQQPEADNHQEALNFAEWLETRFNFSMMRAQSDIRHLAKTILEDWDVTAKVKVEDAPAPAPAVPAAAGRAT
jgi:hypothetical protein